MKKTRFIILAMILMAALAGVFALVSETSTNSHSRNRPAYADSDSAACNELVEISLQKIANVCAGVGRNQACYGHQEVSAVLTDPNALFEARGDLVDVTTIQTLITQPLNLESGSWGIALMDIQADMPTSEDASMRLLVVGGVDLTPTDSVLVENRFTCEGFNERPNNLNIRSGPGTYYPAIDVFPRGQRLEFYGRNEAGDWLLSARGWVYQPLTTVTCQTRSLQIVNDAADRYTAPMQSFTLRVDENSACQSAPSGIIIQSPRGHVGNLRINDVDLRVGSTAFVRMEDGGKALSVNNLEGDVIVQAADYVRQVPPGAATHVELDEQHAAAGPPSPLRPYDAAVQHLHPDLMTLLPEYVSLPVAYRVSASSGGGAGNGSPGSAGRPGNAGGPDPSSGPVTGSNPNPGNDPDPGSDPNPGDDPDPGVDPPPGDAPPATGSLTVPSNSYTCKPGKFFDVVATYHSPDGATIASHGASGQAGAVQASTSGGGTTINVNVHCLGNNKTGTVTVSMSDTAGRNFSASFTVTVSNN